jgi:hypothetical protein
MNVNVRACVKEREVKESVRIELVKALRQARFILTGRDIARSGFITTLSWPSLALAWDFKEALNAQYIRFW